MVAEILLVLAYAAIPAAGTVVGALLAERVDPSPRLMTLALHAATGVLVAVISVELVPTTLELAPPWVALVGFTLGGVSFLLLDHATDFVRARTGRGSAPGSGVVATATALDLFSDGLMVGAATMLRPDLGLFLAMGQVPADLPEGFATNASFRRGGVPARRRALYIAALALPIFAGALLGFLVLRGAPDALKSAVLAFTAGALMTLVIEELAPEAHAERDTPRLAGFVFIGGFALFFLLGIVF